MGEKYIPQYVPLYRKYRPKNLSEVVGQEHIKKALTNAISLNKISHAYLFTGPRGTGKTSIARILAKSLNCKDGPTVTPCEVCPSCVDIKNSTPMDVIEIDAASNRKVEDAQNILEKIQYVPVNGKYKIYIIDEVHMLTNHAFNALLKTLEEPPENVIFILATTEPQKVLETITSRCQRFDFRRITTDDIVSHLKHIAKQEKIKIDEDALFTIAKNAAGGMRDSLALLDQVSVLDSAKNITTEDINKLLGRISFDMLNNLSDCIVDSKPQDALELLEKIYNSGNEPTQILINLMGYLKNLLIVKNCQGDELLTDLTQLNSTQIDILKKQSEKVETHQITFLIEKVVYYIKELKTTTNQHLWLEVAIIDLSNLAQNTSLLELQERISKLESGAVQPQKPMQTYITKPAPIEVQERPIKVEKIEEIALVKEVQEQKPVPVKSIEQNIEQKTELPVVEKQPAPEELPPMPVSHVEAKQSDDLGALWVTLLQNISSTPTVSLLTQHSAPIEISEEKIIIGCKENFLKLLTSESKKSAIEEGAQKMFNKSVSVVIKTATTEELSSVIQKKNPIAEKPVQKVEPKNEIKEEQKSINNEYTEEVEVVEEVDAIDEDEDFVEYELSKKSKKKEAMQSDQVSMVMNLFDGKYID